MVIERQQKWARHLSGIFPVPMIVLTLATAFLMSILFAIGDRAGKIFCGNIIQCNLQTSINLNYFVFFASILFVTALFIGFDLKNLYLPIPASFYRFLLAFAILNGAFIFAVGSITQGRNTSLPNVLWQNYLKGQTSLTGIMLYFVASVIVGPLIEEYVFRGVFWNRLSVKYAAHTVFAMSCFFWVALHFGEGPIKLIYLTPISVILGFCRLRTGALSAGSLLHVLMNAEGALFAAFNAT
jgi:membrane protease YdiL (CAAX protease family)